MPYKTNDINENENQVYSLVKFNTKQTQVLGNQFISVR